MSKVVSCAEAQPSAHLNFIGKHRNSESIAFVGESLTLTAPRLHKSLIAPGLRGFPWLSDVVCEMRCYESGFSVVSGSIDCLRPPCPPDRAGDRIDDAIECSNAGKLLPHRGDQCIADRIDLLHNGTGESNLRQVLGKVCAGRHAADDQTYEPRKVFALIFPYRGGNLVSGAGKADDERHEPGEIRRD